MTITQIPTTNCPGWCDGGHSTDDNVAFIPEDVVTHHGQTVEHVVRDEDGRTTSVTIEQAVRANGQLGRIGICMLDELVELTPEEAEEAAAALIKAAKLAREIAAAS